MPQARPQPGVSGVVVFIEVPPAVGGFRALAAALPEGAAGWLGDGDVAQWRGDGDVAQWRGDGDVAGRRGDGDVAGRRLVGTDLPLAEAHRLVPDAALFTLSVAEPMSALIDRFARATGDPADPAHAMAHTFSAAEAATLDLPEAHVGALTRHLSADGAAADAEAVIAHLDTLPVLLGFVQNPAAYAQALEHLFGLDPRTVDPHALGPRVRQIPRPVRETLEPRLAADIALAATLMERRAGGRLYRTPAARDMARAVK